MLSHRYLAIYHLECSLRQECISCTLQALNLAAALNEVSGQIYFIHTYRVTKQCVAPPPKLMSLLKNCI